MSDDLSGFSLLDLFRSEAESQLDLISTGLLGLEGVTDPSPNLVEPMMRAAHSLKGAAASSALTSPSAWPTRWRIASSPFKNSAVGSGPAMSTGCCKRSIC